MSFALFIALNLILSIVSLLIVGGCLLFAYRLRDEPTIDADWRDWWHPLPVALVAEDDAPYGVAA